jgi:hypothetical protein
MIQLHYHHQETSNIISEAQTQHQRPSPSSRSSAAPPSKRSRKLDIKNDEGETTLGAHDRQLLLRAQQNAKLAEFQPQSNVKGMSSCLFIMDDTIRLLEWLPYHYTVLPLKYIIVGIDPHSNNMSRILKVLDRWSTKMNITVWDNDQIYLEGVPYDKAWKRKYWLDKTAGIVNPFHFNKATLEYKSQEHKRRQNIFTAACFRDHHLAGRDWVMNLDTDEFLIPNYYDQRDDAKDYKNASSFLIHYAKTEEGIERARQEALDLREHLPRLEQRLTISEIMHQAKLDRCLKIPALNFTAQYRQPSTSSPYRLSTLSQTRTGPKEGRTTKVLLDVSRARLEYLSWEKVVNVHNPNKRMCGWNGVIGSGTDYISSVFRYHHYVAGTLESYLERAQDYRRRESSKELLEHYFSRNFEPEEEQENSDIFPWIDWFEQKVGKAAAKELLYDPMAEAYAEMRVALNAKLIPQDLAQVEARLRLQ